jgi:ribonuclease P protein component
VKPEGHPAHFRVRKRAGFQNAYLSGKKRVGEHCVVFAVGNDTGHCRLGVTATKKLGNAVHRNRARRLVREAFRRIRTDLPQGYDYVVVARNTIFNSSAAALQPELAELVRMATT